jgi:hypothetical protein
MPRSGATSNDDQQTVLDLVEVKYKWSEAVKKLLDTLRRPRRHLNDTSWANCRISNGHNSISKLRICDNIDYGATMDLHAVYKQNCHENAHVANLVMIAWREGVEIEGWRRRKRRRRRIGGGFFFFPAE